MKGIQNSSHITYIISSPLYLSTFICQCNVDNFLILSTRRTFFIGWKKTHPRSSRVFLIVISPIRLGCTINCFCVILFLPVRFFTALVSRPRSPMVPTRYYRVLYHEGLFKHSTGLCCFVLLSSGRLDPSGRQSTTVVDN